MTEAARDPLAEFARLLPAVLDESALQELAARLQPLLPGNEVPGADGRLYTTAEAAELVGVNIETVRRAIRAGELRVAARIGRSPRHDAETRSTAGSRARSRRPTPVRGAAHVVDNPFCQSIPCGQRSRTRSTHGDPEANTQRRLRSMEGPLAPGRPVPSSYVRPEGRRHQLRRRRATPSAGGNARHDSTAAASRLAAYVADTWAKAYRSTLSESTRRRYGYLYDRHILPELGPLALNEITPEVISRWQTRASRRRRWAGRRSRRRRAARRNPAARARERTYPDQPRARREEDAAAAKEGSQAARTDHRRAHAELRQPARCCAAERPRLRRPPSRRGARAAMARCAREHHPDRARPGARQGGRHQDRRPPDGSSAVAARRRSRGMAPAQRSACCATASSSLHARARPGRWLHTSPGAGVPSGGRSRLPRRTLTLPAGSRCPTAGPRSGKPCKTPAGRVLKKPHVARERPKIGRSAL